jgi:hypothetical protein
MSMPLVVVSAATVFFAGAALGVIAAVSVAVRREDRALSLGASAPGLLSRGARRLTGIWISYYGLAENRPRWSQDPMWRGPAA